MKILITGGSGFIGTNLVDYLLERNVEVSNIDIAKPYKQSHEKYWVNCDILDKEGLMNAFDAFKPDAVVHLAARTDTDPKHNMEYYSANTTGTENLLAAIKNCPSVKSTVITSTQFVHQYQGEPKHDEDFAPHTIYGESKIITEKLTRQANLQGSWTIIRPTNIWGPWHLRYPYEFWKVLAKGLYIHPGKKPVRRAYGYVGNVVAQIYKIIEAPADKIHQKVFYVGENPINLIDWVNGFSVGQTGKKVRIVPRFIVRSVALVGDIFYALNIKFPITSSRYKSMTVDNDSIPMQNTFDTLGQPPYSLEDGVAETTAWMKEAHPHLITK